MINGAHVLIYSDDAEADRAFLRDVLELPHVDCGEGWLIFALPPSEIGVHPTVKDDPKSAGRHEFSLMCADIEATTRALKAKGVACSPVKDEGWGLLSVITLPGGSGLGVYQPRHARPGAG